MNIPIFHVRLNEGQRAAVVQLAARNAGSLGLRDEEWRAEVARRGSSAEMMMAYDPEGERALIARLAARVNA